ncbi:hypothetical protein N7449_004286 [Penicillium cf. viridicatum]|uniref:C2H2-type domain-containing protein n=1 Tax=Penicillium cf. viridicatum TaxID=2972119 RepID=A0A9W9MJ98_9EURO|nr:hypothetical protein N7449_004286 [Penicillium cf. viridicatum]
MAVPRRRDSQSIYRFYVLQDLANSNVLPDNGDFFDYAAYFDNSYTHQLPNSATPLHCGENDANHHATDAFASNAAIFPSENTSARGKVFDPTSDSSAANHDGSSAEQHGDFDCMNYGMLQYLPPSRPSQPDQLFSAHSTLPDLSLLYGGFENIESSSTPPLPQRSLREYRGLPRRKSRYMIQETNQRPNAVFIPPSSGSADPLERWKESHPEGEAASLSAIQNALENPSSYSGVNQLPSIAGFGAGNLFQTHRRPASRGPSTTSGESAASASSQRSNRSGVSVLSNGSQAASDKTSGGIRKKQAGATRKKRSSTNQPRMFCCTFCCDKFKNKFDWMRHEKSLHLNLESWVCAPFGGSVLLPSTDRVHCAYCNQLDPRLKHLEEHKHGPCQQQTRSLRRKDHLVQHLRVFHLETIPLIDDWKRVVSKIPSRCGFCDGRMSTWDERADHLTFHFRKGCTMANWIGDHEFPPEIAQVTHSVPPYMLDFESRSFVPFSATNGAVNDHLSQMLSRASFLDAAGEHQTTPESLDPELQPVQEDNLQSYTEVLTRHLSHYAQQMMRDGVIPTDEMFQLEARQLLFDSEDQWNQTMADNLEWLAKFRGEQTTKGTLQTPEQPPMDR